MFETHRPPDQAHPAHVSMIRVRSVTSHYIPKYICALSEKIDWSLRCPRLFFTSVFWPVEWAGWRRHIEWGWGASEESLLSQANPAPPFGGKAQKAGFSDCWG